MNPVVSDSALRILEPELLQLFPSIICDQSATRRSSIQCFVVDNDHNAIFCQTRINLKERRHQPQCVLKRPNSILRKSGYCPAPVGTYKRYAIFSVSKKGMKVFDGLDLENICGNTLPTNSATVKQKAKEINRTTNEKSTHETVV